VVSTSSTPAARSSSTGWGGPLYGGIKRGETVHIIALEHMNQWFKLEILIVGTIY
jgi:hypothetical protein